MANENRTPSSKASYHVKENSAAEGSQTVEVLYQKLGDRWYAFSLVDDEVFVGSLTEDQIQGAHSPKIAANS
jgi:hypothetical protein